MNSQSPASGVKGRINPAAIEQIFDESDDAFDLAFDVERALPNVPIKYQRQALDAYARWWPSNSKAGRHRQRDARLAYSL
jgi:hypothetical protein